MIPVTISHPKWTFLKVIEVSAVVNDFVRDLFLINKMKKKQKKQTKKVNQNKLIN